MQDIDGETVVVVVVVVVIVTVPLPGHVPLPAIRQSSFVVRLSEPKHPLMQKELPVIFP